MRITLEVRMPNENMTTTNENQITEENEALFLRSKIEENLRKRKHHRIEEQLLRLIEIEPIDAKYTQDIMRKVIRDKYFDKLNLVFQMIAQKLVEEKRYADALVLIRLILHEDRKNIELRKDVLEIVENLFGNRENYSLYLEKSRLEMADSLFEALDKFEKFAYFDRGEFFIHKSWGVGEVLVVDTDRNRIQINFENKGKHFINLEGAPQFLRKLSKNHILVQQVINKEEINRIMKENPVDLIKRILKSYKGSLKLSSIKNLLTKNIIEEKDWNKWWSDTRVKIRYDPYLNESNGNDPIYTLREVAIEYSDEVIQKFQSAGTLEKKYKVLKEAFKIKKNKNDVLVHIKELLLEDFKNLGTQDYNKKLDLFYVYKEIAEILKIKGDELPDVLGEIINSDMDLKEILLDLKIFENQRKFLTDINGQKPDLWENFVQDVVKEFSPKLLEWFLKFIEKMGKVELGHSIIKNIIRGYHQSPELFAWVSKNLLSGKRNIEEFELTKFDLIERLLELLNFIQDNIDAKVIGNEEKKIIDKIRTVISENHYAYLIDLIDNETIDDVKRLRVLLLSNRALSEVFKSAIDIKIRQRRPDTIERVAVEETKTGTIYATQKSIEQKKLEYEHLVKVEIPQNSKEIAEAASYGDITDNAEYETAKQKQKSLMERIKELEKELSRIKMIIKDEVDTSNVTIGTRIHLKSLMGEHMLDFTILGQWDSQPDKNIISFLSTIGSTLLGHKVDDIVTLNINNELNDYRIINIENGLE